MDDLDKYIETRKKRSPRFAKDFDKGYEQFKIGILLNPTQVPLAQVHLILWTIL